MLVYNLGVDFSTPFYNFKTFIIHIKKMIIYQNLSKILPFLKKTTILDLWAWTWKYSIFCASYWHKVMALDNESKTIRKRPEYLNNHPLIEFIKCDIINLPKAVTSKKYKLILLFNVVPFLEKNLFLNSLLPQYINLLEKSWKLLLTFFFDDDKTMKKNISFYDFENFTNEWTYKINNKEENIIKENHLPEWEHTHHIWYLELERL